MLARGIISTPLLWILPWSLLALGCHAVPRVSTQAAQAVDQTAEAVHIAVGLRLENLDEQEIPLDEYTYTFSVENLGSFSGRWAALRTIPPKSSVDVDLVAVIALDPQNIPMPPPGGRWNWQVTGGVRYQAPGILGRILFDVGVRRPSEGFAGSGTLELTNLGQAGQSAQNARLDPADVIGATASASR
ncbi:MAG: hypothetical protein MK085_06175 [Phycisphaerales bacterium]|nr:hypothetical protein [Phycisphaerales bacterium]